VNTITLSGASAALGMALSYDHRWLAVTTGASTLLVSVPELLAGVQDPEVATLEDSGTGQIEAAFSTNDQYIFVTDEDSGELSVFSIAAAVSSGFRTTPVSIGQVPLGPAPVGVAVSPDGDWIYVTTDGSGSGPGELWLIDAHLAAQSPKSAVVTHVDAGCQPVRVALTPTGNMAWVTARASNLLLGFNTADLRDEPSRALRAAVRVGPEPVGVALYDNGEYAVVANSARFVAPGEPQTLTLVDLGAAVAGQVAITGWVAAGAFPREVATDGSVGVVTNFDSRTVQVFSLSS